MVLQVIISLLIGYPLLVLGQSALRWWPQPAPTKRQYLALLPIFFLLGVLATEGQRLADFLLFHQVDYRPFQAGGIYLFNGILSSILGLLPGNWRLKPSAPTLEEPEEALPLLTKIPLRKGDTTAFRALDDITHFEAYDNYAFLYDTDGQRSLCNYSLGYLEERLDHRFLRVHRKYLVNTDLIASIAPHLKGRYVITFADKQGSSIRSSAGYTEQVKGLLRI